MKANKAIEVLEKMIRLNRKAIKQLIEEYESNYISPRRETELQILIAALKRELKRQMYLLAVLNSNERKK